MARVATEVTPLNRPEINMKGPYLFLVIYPRWSKCDALRQGVYLISLYLIGISLLSSEVIVFWMWLWVADFIIYINDSVYIILLRHIPGS